MGTVSTVTIGTNTYSVYALSSDPVADANSYFGGRLGSDNWLNASTNDKKRALVSATRWLDRLNWQGVPTDQITPQPLQHPRTSLVDCNGKVVPDSEVAPGLPEASFELALTVLGDATAQESTGQGSNIKAVGAGSATVEFFQPTINSAADTRLPQIAQDLVRCYLAGNTLTAPSGSGDTTESAFDDCDFNRSEGFS